MDWMDQDLLDQGKLMCPNAKCQSRIGTFSWSGSQCSCGTWVTPYIKLIKSKVDHVYSRSHVRIIQGVIIQPTITNIERQEQAEDISIEESQAY
jgi:hypothetical protein